MTGASSEIRIRFDDEKSEVDYDVLIRYDTSC